MPSSLNRPGVTVESFPPPADLVFRTGVAGFLCPAWQANAARGVAAPPVLPVALLFTSWPDFADAFRDDPDWQAWRPGQLLWAGVQGFFLNGGLRCWVVLYDGTGDRLAALDVGVRALAEIEDVDLVCAPSLMDQDPLPVQQQLIWSAEKTHDDWFLVLNAPAPPPPATDLAAWIQQLRDAPGVIILPGQPDHEPFHMRRPHNAALYHPWLVPGGDVESSPGEAFVALPAVPVSGHAAGIFARTDQRVGSHKAPANEVVEGIVDVVADVDEIDSANAVRAIPGRGLRVWGARTLAVPASVADLNAYVGVRRLILTLDRWLARALDWTVFETNDVRTWVRIHRELNRRLTDLFEQGVLQGSSPDEAFYVKCDDENNPADVRAGGKLQVDIGVAPAVPNEFIKIRLVRSAEGITVA